MNFRVLRNAIFILLGLQLIGHQVALSQPNISIEKGDLKAVFIDNSAYGDQHRSGYNGISELYHKDQDSTLFVPFYAGVNLEHIFGGDSLVSLFEPRREPMFIEKLSSDKVMLHQPETKLSHVESWTTFEMVDPHYIDVDFRFIVHDDELYNHGYIGLFWASYMNSPEVLGINFKGKKISSNNKSKWLYAYSKKHGVNGSHISDHDNLNPYMAPNFNVGLAVEISDDIFTEPYYYGRFHNMVFAYLFNEPKEGFIRFTKSPSGGGDGNPAWDFHYILPDFEVGKEYSINLRVVYKKWSGQKDIEKEFKKWKRKQK